jgi:hypothetical protein
MSNFLNLNLRDLIHGTLLAFLTVFLAAVLQVTQTGNFPILADLKGYALAGATAAISYLIKNIFVNSTGQLFIPESKKPLDGAIN